jgi:menaquinone-dependent protoporphyrinogen IX oxidase
MNKKLKKPKFNSLNEKIIGAPVVYLKSAGKMVTFKNFVKHWEANKPQKADALACTNAILQDYEMTTEEFVIITYGTPAEDTADFLD